MDRPALLVRFSANRERHERHGLRGGANGFIRDRFAAGSRAPVAPVSLRRLPKPASERHGGDGYDSKRDDLLCVHGSILPDFGERPCERRQVLALRQPIRDGENRFIERA